jgi:hypothetical protein
MASITDTFIQFVDDQCRLHGIKLTLKNTAFVKVNGQNCAGYFSESDKEVVVCTNHSKWIGTLVHEFSHVQQWVAQVDVWMNCKITDLIDAEEIISLWLEEKIELTEEQLKDYIDRVIDLELDCEMRTVEHIKKFKLPLNVRNYTKKANVYLRFYKAVATHRKWTNKDIYVAKIWKSMPSTFKKLDYHKDMSFEELALFESVF